VKYGKDFTGQGKQKAEIEQAKQKVESGHKKSRKQKSGRTEMGGR
jgi:hypothetical protein